MTFTQEDILQLYGVEAGKNCHIIVANGPTYHIEDKLGRIEEENKASNN